MQLSLFADDMIQHRENPKDTTRKQSSSVNERPKLIQGTKLIHVSLLHFYTLTINYQKEKLRQQSNLPSYLKEKNIWE